MKIYAISDTHFGHDKLVELSGRPVGFSELLLENLAKSSGDLLIHCGDICIGKDEEHHHDFMLASGRFKKCILVRGNHDHKSDSWYYDHGWDFVCSAFVTTIVGKKLLFTHAPVPKDPQFHANIHGHMHGNNHRAFEGHDLDWHKDLAPEIRDYKPVLVEKLL